MLVTKLRSLNIEVGNSGCAEVRVWARYMAKPVAAIPASMQISAEENQSLVVPRSSISWKEVSAIASEPKPRKSNGRRPTGSLGRNSQSSASAPSPAGMLMKKHQRQE